MRFLGRIIGAMFLLSVTTALLIFAFGQVFWALQEARSSDRPSRPARERVFAANVAEFENATIQPQITAYGRTQSWRSTELRAVVSGAIVAVSPDFRDGGAVTSGQMIFQIDPAKFSSAVDLAQNALREAEVELADANAAIELAGREIDLASQQLALRQQALERQENLKARGISTDAEIENAALALFSAEQAVINQQQALAQVQTRILRAEIAVDRQTANLDEATRLLTETTVVAPFDGVVSNVSAILGQLVSGNEKLGDLNDPDALEVAFQLSSSQYGRLLDASGIVKQLPVRVSFDLEDLPFQVAGKIDRAGAAVTDGQTGRLIYARLQGSGVSVLRSGDFLTITIAETPLENVVQVPAAAVSNNSMMLVLNDENRLEEIQVEVLRQQAESLIITGAPVGREYVTALTPQLGKGIQVRPIRPNDADENLTVAAPEPPEMIVLDDDRKARLLAFVEGNQRMPAEAKSRIVAQLSEPQVPKDIVERLETRMAR